MSDQSAPSVTRTKNATLKRLQLNEASMLSTATPPAWQVTTCTRHAAR